MTNYEEHQREMRRQLKARMLRYHRDHRGDLRRLEPASDRAAHPTITPGFIPMMMSIFGSIWCALSGLWSKGRRSDSGWWTDNFGWLMSGTADAGNVPGPVRASCAKRSRRRTAKVHHVCTPDMTECRKPIAGKLRRGLQDGCSDASAHATNGGGRGRWTRGRSFRGLRSSWGESGLWIGAICCAALISGGSTGPTGPQHSMSLTGSSETGGAGAEDIIAYNCSHPNTTTEALDLDDVSPCPEPTKVYFEPENLRLQVVQTEARQVINGYSCSASYTARVQRCGFNSINYGTVTPILDRPISITPEECRKAARTGEIRLLDKTFKNLTLNVKSAIPYYQHGSIQYRKGGNFYCDSSAFTVEDEYFHNAVLEHFIRIQINELKGVADEDTGIVVFNNGLQARANDGALRDHDRGTIVWEVPTPACVDTISEVYQGMAVMRKLREPDPNDSMLGSIVMIEEEQTGQYAGFVLKRVVSLCGHHCYEAQGDDGLIVCPLRNGDKPISEAKFKEAFDPQSHNFQTQINHLRLDMKLTFYARFEDLQRELCEADRKILLAKLSDISGNRNPHALVSLFGPGHQLVIYPDVSYILRCVPAVVPVVAYPNCTMEIPVAQAGQVRFVDSRTRIIQEYPTIVPCSDITPILWKAGPGKWLRSGPRPGLATPPRKLNVTLGQQVYPADLAKGVGYGIYTPQQLAEHRHFLATANAREAVLLESADAAIRHGQHGTLGIAVTDFHLGQLRHGITIGLFPMVRYLGYWWIQLLGFMVLIGLLKLVVNIVLRMVILIRHRGCGWWILTALWGTAFQAVMLPVNIVAQAVREAQDSATDELTKSAFAKRRIEGLAEIEALKKETESLRNQLYDLLHNTEDRLLQQEAQHLLPSGPPYPGPSPFGAGPNRTSTLPGIAGASAMPPPPM